MRNRAVFTIVQDEPVFLPIWLGYYRRCFDPSDIPRLGGVNRVASDGRR